jgi:VanZ family protein
VATSGYNRRMTLSHPQPGWLRWFWIFALAWVIVGSLAPASSPLMVMVARLHVSDKVLHFSAYLLLASLPVASFRSRRRGIVTGLLMALMGAALEGGQTFSPGRNVELADVFANNLGVVCGLLVGLPLRSWVLAGER